KVGANIYLKSVWEPWWKKNEKRLKRFCDKTVNPADDVNAMFDDMRTSGGYFRNGYNDSDIMWAMGLSWHTVGEMLDADGYLPVERARELLAMIEARGLTKERLAQHYFDHVMEHTEHPVSGMLHGVWSNEPPGVRYGDRPASPNFDNLAAFLRQ